jgi:hypothetical protein
LSKEACIAVVCVLCACALAAATFVERPSADRPPAPEDPVFAGGPATVGPPPEVREHDPRRVRPERSRPGVGTVVRVRRGRSALLHTRPGGRARFILRGRTPFGSETVLAVVARRGRWLGVLSSALRNGRVGWIRDDPRALVARRNHVRLLVDRSERRLVVLRRGRPVATIPVGVGSSRSETPTGRFAVTDKLPGARFTRSYGCCILALTGRQRNLPRGWRGGDRLAIHGTGGRGAVRARSAGCVTADGPSLRWLMATVPLGTVVSVRA